MPKVPYARKQTGEASEKETTEVVDNLIDDSNDVIVIEEITTDSIERPIEEKDESEKDLKKQNISEYAAKADKKIDETNRDKENERSEVEERLVKEQVEHEQVEDEQEKLLQEQAVQEQVVLNQDTLHEHSDTTEKEPNIINDTTAESSRANIVPPVVMIHATAVIDNSPNAALTNEDIGSLAKILGSKDHLVNNVANFEYSYLSTKELRSKFKHTIGLVIFVKTCNLWEGARSYLWKHLGRDTWTLRNGSVVDILKIHQK